MVAFGVVAIVVSDGNLAVSVFSVPLIFLGLLVVVVAEIAKWLRSHAIFAPPKTYGGLTATQRGETVRSNSERTIADYFHRNNIRYVYEQDAMNRRNSRRISRPDFYLPDYGIYVEYWGMLGVEDSRVAVPVRAVDEVEDGEVSPEQHQVHQHLPEQHEQPGLGLPGQVQGSSRI